MSLPLVVVGGPSLSRGRPGIKVRGVKSVADPVRPSYRLDRLGNQVVLFAADFRPGLADYGPEQVIVGAGHQIGPANPVQGDGHARARAAGDGDFLNR